MKEHENRITPNMTIGDVLAVMSEGNPGALAFLTELIQSDPTASLAVLVLDSFGIYGEKIYKLWNDCCGRDFGKAKFLIAQFNNGKYSESEIHENLSQVRAKPFN